MPDRRSERDVAVSTSVQLAGMLDRLKASDVSIGQLVEDLGRRSFGLTLLVLAVVAFLPGASAFVGLLIAWPAVQMVLGHDVAVLPRVVARRTVRVSRLARLIRIIVPRLARMERLIRPRWPALLLATRRLTGMTVLLLGLTLVLPVPLSNFLPALAIMVLALAWLEEDGIALLVALGVALASLAVTGAAVWGTVETIDWLDPARSGTATRQTLDGDALMVQLSALIVG